MSLITLHLWASPDSICQVVLIALPAAVGAWTKEISCSVTWKAVSYSLWPMAVKQILMKTSTLYDGRYSTFLVQRFLSSSLYWFSRLARLHCDHTHESLGCIFYNNIVYTLTDRAFCPGDTAEAHLARDRRRDKGTYASPTRAGNVHLIFLSPAFNLQLIPVKSTYLVFQELISLGLYHIWTFYWRSC